MKGKKCIGAKGFRTPQEKPQSQITWVHRTSESEQPTKEYVWNGPSPTADMLLFYKLIFLWSFWKWEQGSWLYSTKLPATGTLFSYWVDSSSLNMTGDDYMCGNLIYHGWLISQGSLPFSDQKRRKHRWEAGREIKRRYWKERKKGKCN